MPEKPQNGEEQQEQEWRKLTGYQRSVTVVLEVTEFITKELDLES